MAKAKVKYAPEPVIVRVAVDTDCPKCKARVEATYGNVKRGRCPVCKRKLKFRRVEIHGTVTTYEIA